MLAYILYEKTPKEVLRVFNMLDRYVLPKGTSFDNLLQTDIDLMINHINSLGRASLNWFSPINVAKFTLPYFK